MDGDYYSGIYIRVQIGDRWVTIDMSDPNLPEEQLRAYLETKDNLFLVRTCEILALQVRAHAIALDGLLAATGLARQDGPSDESAANQEQLPGQAVEQADGQPFLPHDRTVPGCQELPPVPFELVDSGPGGPVTEGTPELESGPGVPAPEIREHYDFGHGVRGKYTRS